MVKIKAPKTPDDLQYAVEQVIRIATKHKYVLAGVLLKGEPASIVTMSNISDDIGEFFRMAADLYDEKAEQGLILRNRIGGLQ